MTDFDDLSPEDRDAISATVRRVADGDEWGDWLRQERHAAIKAELTTAASAKRAKAPKPPTLERALKAAERAGRPVKGATVFADRVELNFGTPEATTDVELTPEQWGRLI
jgi:hypothetical protein